MDTLYEKMLEYVRENHPIKPKDTYAYMRALNLSNVGKLTLVESTEG